MGIYSSLYKALEGSGISRNPIVTKINDMIIAEQIKKPILIKNKFYMYMDPRPPSNTAAIYLAKREYDHEETELIEENITGGIAIDCGSNIGYYSLLMAQHCNHVYSFEPSEYTYNLLKKNIDYNKLEDKITAKHLAISNRKENLKLYHAIQNSGGNSLIKMKDCTDEYETVQCNTLDSQIPNQKISILKIDVEGFEQEVLEGAKRTLKNTKILLIEFNKIALKGRGKDGTELFKLLKGFKISQVTNNGLKQIKKLEDLNNVKDYCNLWCINSK